MRTRSRPELVERRRAAVLRIDYPPELPVSASRDDLLEAIRDRGLAPGHFRAVLHIAIGRKISKPDGVTVSVGLTWREVAGLLKVVRR